MEKPKSTEKCLLKKLLTTILRSSNASCGLTSKHTDAVDQPVFVSSTTTFHKSNTNPSNAALRPLPATVDCHSCRPARPRNPKPKARRPHLELPTQSKHTTTVKLFSNPYGFTSSSPDDGDRRLFTSEEECKRERFSSKSFSSDSSEFYQMNKKKKKKRVKKTSHRRWPERKVVVEKEGLAVMKQSNDPYGDFKSSVLEMVVENKIVDGKELERLLKAYLELNNSVHHGVIFRVFSDVWEMLFGV